jgi:hypothetical protein
VECALTGAVREEQSVWEYRLVWARGKPPGWDGAWQQGQQVLGAQGRKVEERPDTYLVLLDRADAGLKLRGGQEEDFDFKVLHRRSGGWELWEKCAFPRWNALEVVRMAALLQLTPPALGRLDDTTPGKGIEAFLDAAGIQRAQIVVRKKRLQAAAGDLISAWPGSCADPGSLAELVEITLPGRVEPVFSLCLETMAPLAGGNDPVPASGGLCCGYPELLLRHLKKSV